MLNLYGIHSQSEEPLYRTAEYHVDHVVQEELTLRCSWPSM